MNDGGYIQYGCGWHAPVGWRNFDASPTLRFERLPLLGSLYTKNENRFPKNVAYGDVVKGLPVVPASCRAVYCSHVLEHLTLADCRVALRNTHTILQAGGIFRLVLPDLAYSVQQYLANATNASPDAAPEFMRETGLGQESRTRGLKGLVVSWLGNSQHYWMWDYPALARELDSAGFVAIRRATYHDSADARFCEVETEERWSHALGIECRKPE